tara:strand:- start:38 stop:436 length:399 start_codon:yes stop_codon:yes gene_type:complete
MSTLRTNALEGVDAKNSITIVAGAGNITTTNVQEGLVKSHLSASNAAVLEANDLNIASGTDDGTGTYTYTLTNNYSADAELFGLTASANANAYYVQISDSGSTTSAIKVFVRNSSASAADSPHSIISMGILA